MGFNVTMVNILMSCVTSARYKITHAGREFGDIIPERGLRQGDPLSSYLLLVCMEGLTSIIKEYERKGLITGIKVARGAPTVTHMFFADDSYIFCKATKEDAEHVMNILSTYTKKEVLDILKFHEADDSSHYLGLPNSLGRKKSALLGYLKEKVQQRVQPWDGKLLNKGAKIGGSPSYIWRSILEAQQMLKQGMACRLGTGDLISITEDPWLPDVENPFIQTIHPAIQNAKVSSVMVSGENKWDEDLLEDIFDERDINLILSIPLQNNSPDSWYWKYAKCGGYSVKTAYRRIQDSKPGQNSSVNPCFWKNL
ncbi:uncharacterized protein LOC108195085 [Daucus carota subsp. sativus]|uniref:uncharacterized protein LOC108195085 n=1 Tax=Daucus carota subsp. sativus TaxID=79200 RepID=UPI0007EF4BF7|nr:PREDICTED: uncharacterized protein LOC108195085 [Daucus carota subsp. sativus]